MEKWLSRLAHNQNVVGSNPTPAPNYWSRGIVVIIPDCLSGDRGSIPLEIAMSVQVSLLNKSKEN